MAEHVAVAPGAIDTATRGYLDRGVTIVAVLRKRTDYSLVASGRP